MQPALRIGNPLGRKSVPIPTPTLAPAVAWNETWDHVLTLLAAVSNPMSVIFLDIDGVLNCDKTPNPRKLPYVVNARLLERLKRLLALTSAKVVLTSTWRYDPAGLFAAHHSGIPFVDVIPDMPDQPRREEILAWLRVHPNVLRYAVIDDEDDELDDLPLFQPLARVGLSNGIVEGVTAYLEERTDKDMRRTRFARFFQNIYASLRNHEG
jgi:hypothetical protein